VCLLARRQWETILESFQSRVAVLEMRLEEANIRITKLEAAAMEAAVPAATSQGASGSSEMPDGLPLLPAAAPPPTSQGANSNSDPEGMIRVQWMHHPRPASVPAPLKACRHNHPEWFTERFSHEAPGSEKFTGARDIDWSDHWAQNKLWAACTGASTSWDLPDSGEASLYQLLKERPDMQTDYHNPPGSGAFYVRFGCANCKRMTPVYQPQYEHRRGRSPTLHPKKMKQHIRIKTSFRVFIQEVFGANIQYAPCRFKFGESTDSADSLAAICDR